MIREVLAEELRRVRAERGPLIGRRDSRTDIREEPVAIASDADLAAFVRRLLAMTGDDRTRHDIEAGRVRFRLAGRPHGVTAPHGTNANARAATPAEQVAHLDEGFVSERQVDDLPAGTTKVVIGKSVRFTPLAMDRLRQRGITIEREG